MEEQVPFQQSFVLVMRHGPYLILTAAFLFITVAIQVTAGEITRVLLWKRRRRVPCTPTGSTRRSMDILSLSRFELLPTAPTPAPDLFPSLVSVVVPGDLPANQLPATTKKRRVDGTPVNV